MADHIIAVFTRSISLTQNATYLIGLIGCKNANTFDTNQSSTMYEYLMLLQNTNKLSYTNYIYIMQSTANVNMGEMSKIIWR